MRSLSAVPGGVDLGLWVSVPAYTGEIKVETAHSLNVEMLEAFNKKIPYLLTFHEQDSIITRCRNAMVMNFLDSDPKAFTDMVFVDSDVGFPPGALLRLAAHPVDIVGGCYPFRNDPIGFPATFRKAQAGGPDTVLDPATGLLEMSGLPAGFLKIGRAALTKIMERFPDYFYNEENVPQKKAWRFFEFINMDHKFFGEDYAFCALAREAGLQIWCDTNITLKHVGMKQFIGNLQMWIEEKTAPPPADPMAAIIDFNEKLASGALKFKAAA